MQSHNGNGSAARAGRQRRWYRLAASFVLGLGLLLLASNLGLLPAGLDRWLALAWPALLVAGGALAAGGGLGWQRALPNFAFDRGEFDCAELHARTGAADLQVRAFAGSSQLAVGQFPSQQGPALMAEGREARLLLTPRLATPYLSGTWVATLAKGLPWSLRLTSGLGHFDLNLRDLAVTDLELNSTFGSVDLTLPALVQSEMQLRLGLGDLTVRVPEGVEARLKVTGGPLASIGVDERRFINIGAGEWCTPLYAAAHERCLVSVRMGAGDIKVC